MEKGAESDDEEGAEDEAPDGVDGVDGVVAEIEAPVVAASVVSDMSVETAGSEISGRPGGTVAPVVMAPRSALAGRDVLAEESEEVEEGTEEGLEGGADNTARVLSPVLPAENVAPARLPRSRARQLTVLSLIEVGLFGSWR